MAKKYIFDRESVSFKKVGLSAWALAGRVFKWLSGAIALAVVYYVVFSLLFNTDVERQLSRENKAYQREYAALQQKQRLLSDVVLNLQSRDDDIYRSIFHSAAPTAHPVVNLVADDSETDASGYAALVESSRSRLDSATAKTARIEAAFQDIFKKLSRDTIPPMCLPVKKLTYTMTGASVGPKYNPFYKVESNHEGLDIIVTQGDPVFATADGVVENVVRSAKGLGNVVTISHGNGYVTRYAHLGQVNVIKGQKVRRGQVIAEVGVSGKSFAPHLHYEVRFADKVLDPVNYFFGALDQESYAGVSYMAAHTEQSLD
ncbi:MAG: M23 family metallopeptidase [Bacteroidales bacterium]|nr:M23 family metallopeptidase [Bacteroidales bacterium]MBQ2090877.1 M23 family metallopeptidase [Bacteroidales bacterium]